MQKVRFWDPEHWRFRAEETRTVADQMTHEGARAIMRRIALDYDRLAKLAAEQLADQKRGAFGDKTKNLFLPPSGPCRVRRKACCDCACIPDGMRAEAPSNPASAHPAVGLRGLILGSGFLTDTDDVQNLSHN